ncbi:MAG: GNAT family protein [Anaerolineales bacterium]|nr:GNAT family protein [Anaerolineales bacterium]
MTTMLLESPRLLNVPAQRTLEKLNFRREAHFVENLWFRGRWSSEYWYALLEQEWFRQT